ncbi:MAG: hypothetical protein HY707_14480 [Ignavibacteriae bacterium]|nr:hypothetical protein [Ignavibacteriota bacterium]
MSDYAKCPKCQEYVILKYPLTTKLNPLSPIKLFAKVLSGKFEDQIVICPKCGYKARYGDFEH